MTKIHLLPILLALLSIFLLLGACSDKPVDPFAGASMVDQLEGNQAIFHTNRAAPKVLEELPSFNLIYEGELETLLATNGTIDHLMQEYDLSVAHSFEIDANYKGLTLQALSSSMAPVELGKLLSVATQVMMVEVKKAEKNHTEEYL